jgi:hypothetical protein
MNNLAKGTMGAWTVTFIAKYVTAGREVDCPMAEAKRKAPIRRSGLSGKTNIKS